MQMSRVTEKKELKTSDHIAGDFPQRSEKNYQKPILPKNLYGKEIEKVFI